MVTKVALPSILNTHQPFRPTGKPISLITFRPNTKENIAGVTTIRNVKINSSGINPVRIKSTHSHSIIVSSMNISCMNISMNQISISISIRTITITINCIIIKRIGFSGINIRIITKTSILSPLTKI